MLSLKFKLKKISTGYQVTNSYFFNNKHNAESYLNSIRQILDFYDLFDGVKLSGYLRHVDFFKATFKRINLFGFDIDCEIDFETTTLTITVKE